VPGERSRRPAAACARWQRIDCLRKRLLDHTSKDMTGYLEQAGQLDRITDLQFVRIIDGCSLDMMSFRGVCFNLL